MCRILQIYLSIAHCLFCFKVIDARMFYSKKKFFVPARSIPNPEVLDKNDLYSDNDESDFALESDLESETEQ